MSCLDCQHCYNKKYCTLCDDLIELLGKCPMFKVKRK